MMRISRQGERKKAMAPTKGRVLPIGVLCLVTGSALLSASNGFGGDNSFLRRFLMTDESQGDEVAVKICSDLAIESAPMLHSWDERFEGAEADESFGFSFHVAADTSLKNNDVPAIIARIGGEKGKFRLMALDLAVTRKESTNDNLIGIDIGANRGIWSFGMAASDLEVHSFEISPEVFELLQHGKKFNSPAVNDRVHLYPMGMADQLALFAVEGEKEISHLVPSDDGSILGLTFDCFAEQTGIDLNRIAFVKVDAEGFDIKFLRGTYHSLFRDDIKIPSFTMEINPEAWINIADTTVEDAVDELKKISKKFSHTYMILNRHMGANVIEHYKSHLTTKEPLVVGDLELWELKGPDEIAVAIMDGQVSGDVWMTNNADKWDM